jgi:hypothetical protein
MMRLTQLSSGHRYSQWWRIFFISDDFEGSDVVHDSLVWDCR